MEVEDGWSIEVDSYHLPESKNGRFSSDWLNASLKLRVFDGIIVKPLNFLLIEELEQLQYWLRYVASGKEVSDLKFVDPEIRFQRIVEKNRPIIKLTYHEMDEPVITMEMEIEQGELGRYDMRLTYILDVLLVDAD